MTLSELSDPNAVLRAIEECDRLGRERFLSNYGYGEAREYFLEYGGRRYDSKAISGVAHGLQFGEPLRSGDFSGGDRTVAAKLAELGFFVTRPHPSWETPIGLIMTKTEISKLYGGSIYGGIEPSRRTPNVMIFTDPLEGAQHGYKYDEFDANEVGVFFYTGEGQVGDQQMTQGNRAIFDHAEDGRVLRLFEAVDGKPKPGGKLQRYVGAFYVDGEHPYAWRTAPDSNGDPRQVIVFKLRRDETLALPKRPVPEPSAARVKPKPATEASHKLCPTCFTQLPISGVCDYCA